MVERITIDITWNELVYPPEGVRDLLVQLIEDFDAAPNGETLPVSLQLIQLAIIAREAEMKGDIDDFLRLKPAADLQPSDSAG